MLFHYLPICYLYLKQNKPDKALEYASRSWTGSKIRTQETNKHFKWKLSELYQKSGNYEKALQFYKKFIAHKDSLKSIKIVQKQTLNKLWNCTKQIEVIIESTKNKQRQY
jgi:tetratricopeptide (TPR) repeat protein